MKIGVLALQGAVREHMNMIIKAGEEPVAVKNRAGLEQVDALILPGGESTAIGKLMSDFGLKDEIVRRAKEGMPVWGTCAGMILLAKHIVNQDSTHLNLMDIWVRRNAYGSQLDSFITHRAVPGVSENPIPLVFIRAPYVEKVGPEVKVLLEIDGKVVAARQGNLLATAFHPELTEDLSFHRYFISMAAENFKQMAAAVPEEPR
ncbi:pyridoxal 5'-phosphate synthase glutaminase subunit PdxT [Thermoanaerobacterium sp. DL9XJH110]|uniref:pyridoxal 5'-phosphate synthase glutaminase subunit PdxT n=1 Tax=Thermoanaerobacterium sp. DL9XJH110 TaxID=3386643 RepID=UPI003BB5EEDC